MGTAGDDYLSRLLGTDEPTGPDNEITEAEAKARAAEHTRVFNTRFNPFNDGSTTATTTMHGTGPGGYRFDAETIKSKITQWEQLLHDLQTDARILARARSSAQPPSQDAPAVTQVSDTWRSIDEAINHNKAMQVYTNSYIDSLRKANGTYVSHDQDVADTLGANSDTGNLYK